MKNNNYVLGLDIGITSVGFGIIDKDSREIIDFGVRLFEEETADENSKRREKRSLRRVIRRRHQRIEDLLNYLHRVKLINKDTFLVDRQVIDKETTPYDLRKKGLQQALTNLELAVVLVHLAKRRGSGLEVAEEDTEKNSDMSTKKILARNSSKLANGLNIVDVQLEEFKVHHKIRGIDNNYKQEDYLTELLQILSNMKLSQDYQNDIVQIIFRKRHFSEGPGSKFSPSPYGQYRLENGKVVYHNLIEEMRGKCSVYPSELRAPKMAFSSDLYNLLNDLNNLSLDGRKIQKQEKEEIINSVILRKGKITLADIAKITHVEIENISGFRINEKDKPIFTEFKGYIKLSKALKAVDTHVLEDVKKIDQLFLVLTSTKILSERQESIKSIYPKESHEVINILANLSGVKDYHSLSFKAIYEFIDEMLETPLNQMQIVTQLELKKNQYVELKGKRNIPYNDKAILNPVAKRAQRQAILVTNLLRKKYGEFSRIIVETARDKNSKEQRDKIRNIQQKNRMFNLSVEQLLEKDGIIPDSINHKTKIKLKLYEEQNGKCIYTGHAININQLIEDPNAYEIEHIIPYAKSFDNSLNNKVLAESSANKHKGKLTPFEYFQSGKAYGIYKSYDEYKINVLNNPNLKRKRENLLFEGNVSKYTDIQDFVARNLVDTRYATKSLMNTLNQYFSINEIHTNVMGIRGKTTDAFRKKYDLLKDRNHYMHHAIDALIISGISTQKNVLCLFDLNKISSYHNDVNEYVNPDTGEVIKWNSSVEYYQDDTFMFAKRIRQIKENEVKFSYKIDKKANRQIADETIYSTRVIQNEEYLIKKIKDIYSSEGVKLAEDIKKDKFDKYLFYIEDKKNNRLDSPYSITNLFKKIVNTYPLESNPFAKYQEEHGLIRKPTRSKDGSIIKQIKYIDSRLGNHLDISKKYIKGNRVVLLQTSAYRTDFYQSKSGEYKFVTVRRFDVRKEKHRYYIDPLVYQQLLDDKKINQDFHFVFSLNRNEIVKIVGVRSGIAINDFYRFIATNNDNKNQIEVKSIAFKDTKLNEKTQTEASFQNVFTIGKSIVSLTKYYVSPIGEYKKCVKESLKLVF